MRAPSSGPSRPPSAGAVGEGPAPGAEVPIPLSYVLPLRMAEPVDERFREELTSYLTKVSRWCAEVIVVDGSSPAVFAANHRRWSRLARHVAPDPGHAALMGKVPGVLTGLDLAAHEAVVIADDDVRYTRGELRRVVALLTDHDVVRPQNYFDPRPWHALWDSARTLLNRAAGADFPGTLGVRRSTLRATGGYDGNVLFENLELMRTVEAHGGRVVSPLDLYVRRLPPTAAHFLGQRTRQAYDDFALPARMATWLAIVPLLVGSLNRRRPAVPAALAAGSMVVAEVGRRRAGGAAVFSPLASLLAPAWLAERGVCAWLALAQRVRWGGVRYGSSVIAVAAHSPPELRRRATTRSSAGLCAGETATPTARRPSPDPAGSRSDSRRRARRGRRRDRRPPPRPSPVRARRPRP